MSARALFSASDVKLPQQELKIWLMMRRNQTRCSEAPTQYFIGCLGSGACGPPYRPRSLTIGHLRHLKASPDLLLLTISLILIIIFIASTLMMNLLFAREKLSHFWQLLNPLEVSLKLRHLGEHSFVLRPQCPVGEYRFDDSSESMGHRERRSPMDRFALSISTHYLC